MRIISTFEMRQKEVINLCDGSRLGYACDFEFCVEEGRIIAIIITAQSGFLGLGKVLEIVIPWDKIQCIGEDTVLVKIPTNEFSHCQRPRKKKNWFF